jgi:hypothetical protein
MKIFIVLLVAWFSMFIFTGGALAVNKSSHTHKASIVLPLDGAEPPPQTYAEPTPLMYESLQPNCDDINPDPGVVVIQHDQWAMTYYDKQKNGSMGRMIAVSLGGHRNMICHETRGVYGVNYPRWVTYNCKDPLSNWVNPDFGVKIDGGTNNNAGYSNIGVLHDGRAVGIYHRYGGTAPWATTLAVQDSVCSSFFLNKYDLPDSLGGPNDGIWPKMGIVYDDLVDTDYIHVVPTEGNTTGGNQKFGYVRCHLISGGNLLCEWPMPNGQAPGNVTIPPNTMLVPNKLVACFGEAEAPGVPPGEYPNDISAVVATSPVSQKVALVFVNKRESGTNQVNNDVYYFESTNNGTSWFPQYGGTWPPSHTNGMLNNITNYPTSANERAYTDVSACYDYNDNLHIVWNAPWYDSVAGLISQDANLYHWSQATGISMVAFGYWDGAVAGGWCRNICKMSVSAQDPIYHPGGSPDSVYLFCIWTQFNGDNMPDFDNSLAGYTNGEIYAAVSSDGGLTWTPGYNLTGTHTPNCATGTCLSEHWSSLAQNMYDGDLHIEYVCDRDPGSISSDEGGWTDNPMMYLHIAQLSADRHCGISYPSLDPPSFDIPPIKVPPGGSKTITLELKSLYNAGGYYQVTSSNPSKVSIDINSTGFLNPNDSVTVQGTIHCTGEEFIQAIITVIGCKSTVDADTIQLPLYAVCSNDYYDCRSDPKTTLGIDNGVCSLWTTSNTLQILWDKRIVADDMEGKKIIAAASPFAATVVGTDTVVGIEESDKSYTGARDTINMRAHLINAAPNCYIKRGIVEKTYLWFPRPYPQNPVWYWLDLRQQIITFVDRPPHTCEDFYKEQVIKQVWVKFSRPPNWWPSPGVYSGHDDIYFGFWADIDAPSDTGCIACNTAGWDDTRKIIWHHGRGIAGGHPEYSNHYVGLALTDPTGAVIDPLGVQDVKNNVYIYPHSGWVIDSLYQLTATPGVNIHDPDSVADRTAVLTAGKIDAGGATDTLYVGKFIIIEATIKGGSGTGLSDLQTHIDNTRSTIIPLLNSTGVLPKCGDVNCDGNINSADVGYLLNYLFVGGPPPCKPFRVNPSRADVSGDGKVNTADIVYLINYLFVSGSPAPNCPGM